MITKKYVLSPISISVSITLLVLLLYIPYRSNGLPLGWDTPWYYYMAKSLAELGPSAFTTTGLGRIVTQAILYFVYLVFSQFDAPSSASSSIPQFLIFSQTLFISLYIVSIYYMAYRFTKNYVAASLSAILGAISNTTLRYQPNLSAVLCVSLIIFAVPNVISYVRQRKRRNLIVAVALSIMSLFSDPFFLFYFASIFAISSLIIAWSNRNSSLQKQNRPFITKRALVSFTLIVVSAVAFFALYPYLLFQLVTRLTYIVVSFSINQSVQAITFISNWFVTLQTIMGIIGLVFVNYYFKERLAKVFFLVWFIVTLILSLLALQPDYDRIFSFAPYSISASLLSLAVVRKLVYVPNAHTANIRARKIFVLLVIGVVFSVSFFQALSFQEKTFLGPYISQNDYQQLVWIRDNFPGHSIVMISKTAGDQLYWCQAIIWDQTNNMYLYFGNLTGLLKGNYSPINIDNYLIPPNVIRNITGYTIVVPLATYDVGSGYITNYLQKVPDKSIYYFSIAHPGDAQRYYLLFDNPS